MISYIDNVKNVVTEIPLTILPTNWSATAPYVYTWEDSRILAGSSIDVDVLASTIDTSVVSLDYEKAAGSITFTATSRPVANIAVTIRIINARSDIGNSISADMVSTSAIDGASNVDQALTALNRLEGSKVYTTSALTITNTSGSYSNIFYDENISSNMEAIRLEIADPSVFNDDITITPGNGTVTVACSDVVGSTTIKIVLEKVAENDPTAITSTEFTLLNNRLLAVENICTDSQISIATTDWASAAGGYVYTWMSNFVTTPSEIEVFLRDGAENAGIEEFDYDKVTGGVQFTVSSLPTASLPVTIRVINAKADAFQSLTGEDIATDVITGATNVDEALTALNENTSKLSVATVVSNANDALKTGIYKTNATTSNVPYAGYFVLIIKQYGNNDTAQIAVDVNTNRLFTRTLHDSTIWTDWRESVDGGSVTVSSITFNNFTGTATDILCYRNGNVVTLAFKFSIATSTTGNAQVSVASLPTFGKTYKLAYGQWYDNTNDQAGEFSGYYGSSIRFVRAGVLESFSSRTNHSMSAIVTYFVG